MSYNSDKERRRRERQAERQAEREADRERHAATPEGRWQQAAARARAELREIEPGHHTVADLAAILVKLLEAVDGF